MKATLVDTHIQGHVVIYPSAQLESSMVRGPAVIGAGARLRDANVGPYSSIGRDVLLEGAEVEHSIVLPGASICHLGGRLEGSVVGPGRGSSETSGCRRPCASTSARGPRSRSPRSDRGSPGSSTPARKLGEKLGQRP